MDYRLKLAYEQILKGEPSKEQTPSQPKNLTEAYHLLLEEERTRHAIYSKKIENNQESPNTIEGAIKIGYTEYPERLKSMLNSTESRKIIDQLISGWENASGFSPKFASQKLIEAGLSVDDLTELINKKNSLTDLQTSIRNGNIFNFKTIIVNNVISVLNNSSVKSSVEQAFDYLLNIKPTIGGAAAGKGELVATVFTNAVKPSKGDLAFSNNSDIVELKYGKSRFGKDKSTIIYDKEFFLKTLKQIKKEDYNFDPVISDKLTYIRKKLKEIKNLKNFEEHIKPEYFNDIESILQNPNQKDSPAIKKLFRLMPGTAVIEYLKDAKEPIGLEKNFVKAFKQKHKLIVSALDQLLNLDNKQKKLNSGSTQNIIDYVEKNQPASILKALFTRNLDLTSDEAAKLFCSMYNANVIPQEIIFKVREFFSKNYDHMVLGHKEYLDAILFAFNLAIYQSEDDFQYLLLVNDKNNNSISFDASGNLSNIIETASNKFLQNHNDISISYTNNPFRRLEVGYKK